MVSARDDDRKNLIQSSQLDYDCDDDDDDDHDDIVICRISIVNQKYFKIVLCWRLFDFYWFWSWCTHSGPLRVWHGLRKSAKQWHQVTVMSIWREKGWNKHMQYKSPNLGYYKLPKRWIQKPKFQKMSTIFKNKSRIPCTYGRTAQIHYKLRSQSKIWVGFVACFCRIFKCFQMFPTVCPFFVRPKKRKQDVLHKVYNTLRCRSAKWKGRKIEVSGQKYLYDIGPYENFLICPKTPPTFFFPYIVLVVNRHCWRLVLWARGM